MNDVPEIHTDRLLLRSFRDSDINEYAEMCGDTEVMRYLSNGQPMNRENAWRHMAMIIGHWHFRGFGLWAAELKETGELAGRIGCWQPEGWPGLEVGWTLKQKFWGKGLAFEGAKASLCYAFETLNADRVISIIHPENIRSIKLAKRLGEHFDKVAEVKGSLVHIYAIDRAASVRT
ncbi:MAG TPA: GNAT family N-acetyltransferase [Acidobacteriota bacterium]|nr:GNAT family N-acetyltransferase [Acidobacteriota bacterium]